MLYLPRYKLETMTTVSSLGRSQSMGKIAMCAFILCSMFLKGVALGAPQSQQDDKTTNAQKDTLIYHHPVPLIITATKTENRTSDVPKSVTVVDWKEISRESKLSVLDVLADHPGVWVEKRTSTTSDPVIRGMSGYNILALIDGNTLSTLWGEGGAAGDDMYGKVDADQVERVEVVRGPLSVLYGSNALAGVVNFITKSCPLDYTEHGTRFGGSTKISYATAAEEKRVRTEVYGATQNLRFILGGSFREAGDVRAGGDIGVQVPTSGQDLNWDLKCEYRPALLHRLEFSFSDVDKDDVRRFYRPYETNRNDRVGAYLKYRRYSLLANEDKMDVTFYYQYKKDTRENLSKKERYWTNTKTYSADAQWSGAIGEDHLVTGGIHLHLDDGICPDDEQFVRITSSGVFKDAPDSYWSNAAVYAQDEWNLASRLRLITGIRWDQFIFETRLDSLYIPPGGIDPSIDEIDEREATFTGGLGVVLAITESVNLFGNLSRGFRQYAPVFGIKQHAYGIQVPSGLLNPASSMNYEAGIKLGGTALTGNAAVYYSDLRDFPVVVRTTFEGRDWYDWDGSGSRDPGEDTYVTENSAEAYVWGVEIEGDYQIGSGWSVSGGFAYSYGRDETRDEPLRHTIPAWGTLKLGWLEPKHNRLWMELSAEGATSFDRIPSDRIYRDPGYRVDPKDMDSPLIGPNGKIPGWVVFNLRGEYSLTNRINVNAALENLTDEGYRRVHSRWDEYGINLILGLSVAL